MMHRFQTQNGALLKEKHGDSLLLSYRTLLELGGRSHTVCEHTHKECKLGELMGSEQNEQSEEGLGLLELSIEPDLGDNRSAPGFLQTSAPSVLKEPVMLNS